MVIPFRIGIGGAVHDGHDAPDGDWNDDVDVDVRAPLQIAFQFKESPVELYLEISLAMELIDDTGNLDLDGGLGFRIYF